VSSIVGFILTLKGQAFSSILCKPQRFNLDRVYHRYRSKGQAPVLPFVDWCSPAGHSKFLRPTKSIRERFKHTYNSIMDDIVQDAVENKEQEDRKSNVDTATDDNGFGEPRIVVVGCGGAGNNTINRLYNIGVDGADTVALNTDKQHLKQIQADTKILVGKEQTKGLGAGGEPSVGEKATKQSASTIKEVLSDAGHGVHHCGDGRWHGYWRSSGCR